jgi:ferredoxin-NADP reductase
MAMLRDLVARDALPDTVLVHVAPSRDAVIFGPELRRLGRRRAALRLYEHHDDAHGRFDVAGVDRLVPDLREREAWACGPEGLLDALGGLFADAGMADRLHVERFRPVVAAPGVTGQGGRVTFAASGTVVDVDGSTPLLVAGEQAGALLPSGCRMGICHTCVGRLRSGAVRDLRTGEVRDTPGEPVQTCVSAAHGPAEIDL